MAMFLAKSQTILDLTQMTGNHKHQNSNRKTIICYKSTVTIPDSRRVWFTAEWFRTVFIV